MIEPTGSRSSEATRRALIDAATSVFAEHGYAGGSVRTITRAAGANQAAITYHFGGKDGLYRAVLRQTIAAFEDHSLLTTQDLSALDRVEALRLAMREFLAPLSDPGRLGRYVRILGWESIHPTPVYLAFFLEEPPKLFGIMEQLVARFLPENASRADVALVMHWLMQQPVAIVRNAERLKAPPYSLTFDEASIDRLVTILTELSLMGLAGAATSLWSSLARPPVPDRPNMSRGVDLADLD